MVQRASNYLFTTFPTTLYYLYNMASNASCKRHSPLTIWCRADARKRGVRWRGPAARLQLGDAAGEQAFRRTLSDDYVLRRLEAIDYLLDLDHPASAGLLKRARGAGPEVVSQYAELALLAHDVGTSTTLEEGYEQSEREVRLAAVMVAERLLRSGSADRKVSRAARRVVESAAVDEASEVRAAAFAASGEQGVVDMPFEQGIRDEVHAVRIEAAGALLSREAG